MSVYIAHNEPNAVGFCRGLQHIALLAKLVSAMRRIALALLVCAAPLASQTKPALSETPALEFTGSPLVVPFTCNSEDLQWAGLTCTEQDCPIYLELSRAAGQGSSILLSGDFHAAVATMQSLLLRSVDGGRKWSEPFERILGAQLDAIQVYDAQTAWISGELMQPLPIDPFLLRTSDGGQTWERLPLFEVGTPGVIVQFYFEDREHGRLITQHGGGEKEFAVYETHTGGREWSQTSTSDEAPKLKSAAESDWRVHAEPKLFRLEHREEGHWLPFAAFAIQSASCRETPETESPGTEETPTEKPESSGPRP